MSFVVAYALAGAGTLLVVLWVMLYLRYSSQYDVMIAAIDKKQFFPPGDLLHRLRIHGYVQGEPENGGRAKKGKEDR